MRGDMTGGVADVSTYNILGLKQCNWQYATTNKQYMIGSWYHLTTWRNRRVGVSKVTPTT